MGVQWLRKEVVIVNDVEMESGMQREITLLVKVIDWGT
jgi:hypothetical protein